MLSLLSWNLDGLEDRHLDVRMEAAALSILSMAVPPDILVFQEVVDRALVAHLRRHLGSCGYMHAVQPATGDYYTAIFVRAPLRLTHVQSLPFPNSQYGRALLEAQVSWRGLDLRVQTAHLDSGRDAGKIRRAQLNSALERLLDHDGPGLFAGDTNLRDADVAGLPRLESVTDAWLSLGRPRDCASTWAPRQRATPGRPQWTRFDRVYCTGLLPTSMRAFGQSRIAAADDLRVSDHVGLQIDFELG